jgi:hypothetical protein
MLWVPSATRKMLQDILHDPEDRPIALDRQDIVPPKRHSNGYVSELFELVSNKAGE